MWRLVHEVKDDAVLELLTERLVRHAHFLEVLAKAVRVTELFFDAGVGGLIR